MEKERSLITKELYSKIEQHLKNLRITYRVKWNNFYIFCLEDYFDIENELLLKVLKIEDKVKLEKISVLWKRITIYDIENWSEYVKIIFEWTVLETIKYHLLNLFGK